MDFWYRGDGGVYFDSIGRGGLARSYAVFFFRAAFLGDALFGAGSSLRRTEPELFERTGAL
jgi:hypothetical protein